MKAKHLIFTMALAGVFGACSQDELVNGGAESPALAKRHNAGVVEFSVDNDAETRFNHALSKFNDGETIDLYLMDELTGTCDDGDANHMHGLAESVECWKYFNVWNELYTLKNYAQTRYPFAYDAESDSWKNQATLLEGNYFAMHPGNEKITNRKDVWHYINPVQGFSKDGKFYNKALDNQFWLGYTPIYRDEDRTGDMTLPLSMQPIMTVLKLNIGNTGNRDVIVDKIVFKDGLGGPLPTIAYVRPATVNEWRKTEEVDAPMRADQCGEITCNNLLLNSRYSKELTWNKDAKPGRETARSIVTYATPADHVPYGLENTTVAYEYVFNFDEASELGGHFLEGNVRNGEWVSVYFALPHNLTADSKLEPVIYGRVYDGANKVWKYGILRKGDFTQDNGSKVFTLDAANLGKLQPYAQEVTASFDEYGFEALTNAKVSSTDDLMRYLEGMETSFTSQTAMTFDVDVYGNGLIINKDVIEFLNKQLLKKDCKITLNFHALNNTNVDVILDYDNTAAGAVKDCMKFLNFSNGSEISLIVEKGNHAFEENLSNQVLNELVVKKDATFNMETACYIGTVANDGVLNIAAISLSGNIENHYIVNFNSGACLIGRLTNEKEAYVKGGVTGTPVRVMNITNQNTCLDCGGSDAVLTIENGAVLEVGTLTNGDIVINNGSLTVETLDNTGSLESNGTTSANNMTNTGKIEVKNGKLEILVEGTNEGIINVAANAEMLVDRAKGGVLKNTIIGVVNVEGDLMENIQNSGYIYVIKDGHVIVDGCIAGQPKGIIDVTKANNTANSNQAKDTNTKGNYFRYDINGETTATALAASLKGRISELNYGVNNVIVRWTNEYTSASSFSGTVDFGNVQRIIIGKDLLINGDTSFKGLSRNCYAVDCNLDANKSYKAAEILMNATVTVANDKKLEIGDDMVIWVDGKVKVNNWAKLAGDVKVAGAGRFEFDTPKSNVTWAKSGLFTGDWLGFKN